MRREPHGPTVIGYVLAALSGAIVSAIVLGLASAAHAQELRPGCYLSGDLRQALKNMGDRPVAIGLTSTTSLLEVYVSAAGEFTIAETTPDGISCLLRAGTAFEFTIGGPAAPEGTPG